MEEKQVYLHRGSRPKIEPCLNTQVRRHTDAKLRTILLDLIGLYMKRVYFKTITSIIMLSLPNSYILDQATCDSYFTSTLPVLLRIKPFLNATDLNPTALFGRQVKQFMQGYPWTFAIQYFCNNASVYEAVILSIRVFIY